MFFLYSSDNLTFLCSVNGLVMLGSDIRGSTVIDKPRFALGGEPKATDVNYNKIYIKQREVARRCRVQIIYQRQVLNEEVFCITMCDCLHIEILFCSNFQL